MAVVYRYVGILTVDVVFFQSPDVFHSQDSFPSTSLCSEHTYILRMSPTAGDETSRGRNPENGRRQDFGKRRHQQSGFQHINRPWPSSPELFNKDHNAGRENLSHLKVKIVYHTVPFAEELPAARQLAMATADSPGPGLQIESNTTTARRPTIE